MMKFILLAALAACAAATCTTERDQALILLHRGMLGVFVPNCEADGSWSPRQCHAGTRTCHCRLPDGTQITRPSREQFQCNCPVKRIQQIRKHMLGVPVPECEANGLFKKIQCHQLYCHCVHPETGEKLSESVHRSQLDSLQC